VQIGPFDHYREVLAYRRWSSKRQSDGASSSRQDDLALVWAQRHGITLSKRKLVDEGRSGFHGKNLEEGGALGQLLEEVKAGKIPTPALLLVEAQDRFGRRPPLETLQRIFGQCLDLGLDLYLLDRDLLVTTKTVNSDVSVLIRLALEVDAAHRYSARLSTRMLQAHEQGRKAQAAGQIARAGWRPEWIDLVDAAGNVIPRTASREQVKTGVKWQLNAGAAVVERVIAMAEQGHGQTKIAQLLNADGVPPLRAERTLAAAITKAKAAAKASKKRFDPALIEQPTWSPGQVEHLLGSVAVAGGRELKRRTGEVVWDYYPAVIPRPRWEALQQLLSSRATCAGSGRQHSIKYIGQGVTTCAACGSAVGYRTTNHSKDGKLFPVHFVRCRGRLRGTCDQPMLRMEPVVAHILTRLSGDQLAQLFPAQTDGTSRAILLKQVADLQQQHREAKAMAAAAESEIAKALATEPALAAVIGRQVVAAEQKATDLDRELLSKQHELSLLDQDQGREEIAQLGAEASDLLKAFGRGEDTTDQRRMVNALLKRLAIRVVVDGAQEKIGLAVGPGDDISWQPLAAVARNLALSDGIVEAQVLNADPDALWVAAAGWEPLLTDEHAEELLRAAGDDGEPGVERVIQL